MRLRTLIAALAAMAMLLGACGGGDDESLESQADEQSDTTEADSSDDTADESTDDTTDDTTDDGTDDGTDDTSLDDLGDMSDFLGGDCLEFSLAYAGIFLSAMGGMFGGEEEVQQMQDELGDLDASVPDEIADEFAIVQEAYSEYLGELSGLDLFSDEAADLEDPLSDPEVAAADEAIQQYLEEECGG